ncbi:18616_t:CDS:10 [Racocetra persica]|uniref:18616_t:CDS:1 n=1 Tax=Racocetra persica TaxID=160502 RepID=A0ACA9K944_9GLOM|nr:18616_t:CDS:10 [Racocetra persica]
MVDNRDELIKYCFDILWKATEGKINSVTFNENPLFTVTFNLVDRTFKTLNLDTLKVVLIIRKNFIKILRVIEQNKKKVAIDDDEKPSNSLTEIAIQESAQNFSFDIEADSTFLSINNQNSNDSGDPISIPSSPKEKKESIQYADSLSDKYSNSDEENDERKFDAALTLLHEARHSSLQITNNVQENTSNIVNELTVEDKCDEMVDIQMSQQYNINEKKRMEYSLSESSDADLDASGGLQSSNKMVNLSQTSNDPEFGKEIEYKHANTNQDPDVGEVNMSEIAERNKNLSTSLSNINEQNQSDKLIDFQVKNLHYQCTSLNSTNSKFSELQIGSTAYSKCLKSPSDYVKRLNKLRKIKGTSDFASNTNDLVGMYSQPIKKYFNEDSTQVLLELLSKQMKDVGKQQEEMSPIALEKTTDNWKGNDLKAQINKKFGNINSCSILRK